MTHDELLALINDEIEVCEPECNQHQRINAPWLALRAVVELHKPLEQFHLWLDKSMIENSRKLPFMCKLCRVEYPCPTIQAIEKELR